MRLHPGLLIFVVEAALGGAQIENAAPLSVCELLENRLKYHGQIVEVRGIVEGSTEGTLLIGENCRSKTVIKEFAWPNAIYLALFPNYDSPKVRFVPDLKQLRRIKHQVGRLRRKHSHAEISTIYIGMFETRPDTELSGGINFTGERVPMGFGHMGVCPAQLIIKAARDPALVTIK